MRTMFISLILISSLAQFASTEDPPPLTPFLPEGCGDVYDCYVPVICVVFSHSSEDRLKEKTDLSELEKKGVFMVTKHDKITSDCPALIKFHVISPYWAYVSIESFQESNAINSIEFERVHYDGNYIELNTTFVCSIEDKKLIGKYRRNYPGWHQNDVFEKFKKESILETDKINCNFKIQRRYVESKKIFILDSTPMVLFKVNMKSTEESFIPLGLRKRCDPRSLIFSEVEDKEKIFSGVEYNFKENKLKCKGSKYSKIEFIGKGKTEYEEMDQFKCDYKYFYIKSVKDSELIVKDWKLNNHMFHYEDVNIRCFEEVRFKCHYDVKASDQGDMPLTIPPNYDTKKPTELKCPLEKPHLIVEESGEDPILDAKFECRKYGDTAYWTVAARDNRTFILTEEGPSVYCSETVECSIFFIIPDSAVEGGFVSIKDYLPKCRDATGTMWVGDKQVTNSRCDGKDGKFKYTAGGEEKVIDANTKFICKYPPKKRDAELQNQTNKMTLTDILQ